MFFKMYMIMLLNILIVSATIGCDSTLSGGVLQKTEKATNDLVCRTNEDFLHAVQTCQPGQSIRLLPGKYRFENPVHIKTNVSIIGEKTSEDDEILLEGKLTVDEATPPVFLFEADEVTLKNLTFNNIVDTALPPPLPQEDAIERNLPEMVRFIKGAALMVNCRFKGDDGFGIALRKDAVLSMEHCRVEHYMTGIQMGGTSSLALEDCDFQNCITSLVVMSGTKAKITRSRFADGMEGVAFYQDGKSENTAEDDILLAQCEISGMKNNGLVVFGDITPTVRDCRIHHCRSCGLSVINQNSVTTRQAKIENCTIEENEGINVRIVNTSPLFTDCKIIDSHGKNDAITELVRQRNKLALY